LNSSPRFRFFITDTVYCHGKCFGEVLIIVVSILVLYHLQVENDGNAYTCSDADGGNIEYKAGEVYNPSEDKDPACVSQPTARRPLNPKPFLLLETPFSKNLR